MRDTVRGSLYPKKAARSLCALLAAGLLALGACLPKSGTGARKGETRVITIYGFSVMKEVMDKAVLPAFADLRFCVQGAKFTASHGHFNFAAEYGLSWVLPREGFPARQAQS